MSKTHKNPYNAKGNYGIVFAWMQKTRIFTVAQVAAEFKKLGSKNPEASANVVTGPSEDSLGNFSARGDIYFCRRMKKTEGEARKLMLVWRKEPLLRKVYDRENGKVVSVDMAKKAADRAAKKAAGKVVKVVAKKSVKKATKKTVKNLVVKPVVAVKPIKTPVAPVVPAATETPAEIKVLAADIRAKAPAVVAVVVEAPAAPVAPTPETPTPTA